jgi:hypothetical protein
VNDTLNKKARESLWNNSQYFINLLGEPMEEEDGFFFPLKGKASPFSSFKICYEIEKKFLGKIYAMVLEARFTWPKEIRPAERIELHYSGFIRKGTPYFAYISSKKTGINGNELFRLLNHDRDLIDQCWKLEIEFLRMFFDPQEDLWRVQARPYGGSFIHLLFPPMQYNVILVKEQADLIFSIMKRIAGLIK